MRESVFDVKLLKLSADRYGLCKHGVTSPAIVEISLFCTLFGCVQWSVGICRLDAEALAKMIMIF